MRHPCFKTAGSASDSDTSNACSIIPAAGRIQRIENTKFAQYLLYSTLFFAGPSENAVREQAEAMALVETGNIVQENRGMELDNAAKQEADAEAMCMFASLIAS